MSNQINANDVWVSAGWSPKQNEAGDNLKGVIEAKLTGISKKQFDLDLNCAITYADGSQEDVHFGHKVNKTGCVRCLKDDASGKQIGDDEVITLDLSKADDIAKIVFVFCCDVDYKFGDIQDVFIRIREKKMEKEFCREDEAFAAEGKASGAYVFGEMVRADGSWTFNKIGKFFPDSSSEKALAAL